VEESDAALKIGDLIITIPDRPALFQELELGHLGSRAALARYISPYVPDTPFDKPRCSRDIAKVGAPRSVRFPRLNILLGQKDRGRAKGRDGVTALKDVDDIISDHSGDHVFGRDLLEDLRQYQEGTTSCPTQHD
jgi:hypothetical protein